MRSSVTLGFVVAATVVGGLFSSMLDRALVATPAWRLLGVQAWGHFSRHADLGTGNIVYPVGGILLWGLVFAAVVSHRLDRSAPRAAGLPIYLAALASIGAIIATIIWGVYIRGVFFTVSFVCTVWALVITSRNTAHGRAIDRRFGSVSSSSRDHRDGG